MSPLFETSVVSPTVVEAEEDPAATIEQPQWRLDETKRWCLIKAVELRGGDLGDQGAAEPQRKKIKVRMSSSGCHATRLTQRSPDLHDRE